MIWDQHLRENQVLFAFFIHIKHVRYSLKEKVLISKLEQAPTLDPEVEMPLSSLFPMQDGVPVDQSDPNMYFDYQQPQPEPTQPLIHPSRMQPFVEPQQPPIMSEPTPE